MRIRLRTLIGIAVAGAGLAWWIGASTAPATASPPRSPDPQVRRAAAALVAAIATARTPAPNVREDPADRAFGLEVAREARRQLSHPAAGFRDDCSGYVSAVFSALGVPMDHRVATLWEVVQHHDAAYWELEPRAGDLVFFDDTWDRDGNGRLDDDLTHVGIVLDVEPDGTVVFAHAGLSSGRGVGRLNLHAPELREGDDGSRWNSLLRNPRPTDPPGTVYRAGELFAAFARIRPDLDWTGVPDGAP